jgi:hypothetical protein
MGIVQIDYPRIVSALPGTVMGLVPVSVKDGRGERIRTSGLLVPNQDSGEEE